MRLSAAQREQAANIEAAFGEAIAQGDHDTASNLAAGHPDPAQHLALMERLHAARSGAATNDDTQPADAASDDPPRSSAGLRMFALSRRPALLINFNPRAEKHGAESKPAADLRFESNLEATVLDAFHPDLRRLMFCKVGRRDDIADAVHDAPDLRFERMGLPVKWTSRFAGYAVRLHIGVSDDGAADVVLGACDVNNLTFAPQQGGTVIVGWRVQCHPDEHAAGKLAMLVGAAVDVTMQPPADGGEVLDSDDE